MKSNILLVLFYLVFWSAFASATIPLWGQCANLKGSLGDCADGLNCFRVDNMFSVCMPLPSNSITTKPVAMETIPLWGLCADLHSSLGTCPTGSSCSRSNSWYSQCIPNASITTTARSTITYLY